MVCQRRLENSPCQPSSKWVPFFELGKDRAAKGEGWAPPFISCAKIQWDSNLHCPLRLLGYGEPESFIVCLPVRGDNPRALASGLSPVQATNHCITILYLHHVAIETRHVPCKRAASCHKNCSKPCCRPLLSFRL